MSGLCKLFPPDTGGNVAIIFAIALPIIVGAAGGAIDLARASRLRTALTQAVDSAASTVEQAGIVCAMTSSKPANDISDCMTKTGENVGALAQRSISAEFKRAGYSAPLHIDPAVRLNPVNDRVVLSATSSYSCTIFKIVSSSCDINVGSRSHETPVKRVADGGTLTLSTPPLGEIWIGDLGSPALPGKLSASGGRTPYRFAVGPNLPEGLRLDSESGLISGKPADQKCDGTCIPQRRKIAVSVFDASTPNPQTVSSVIAYELIFPLTLRFNISQQGSATSVETVRTGGKPPYRFSCAASLGQALCDSGSGKVFRTNSDPVDLLMTVTDSRGKSANAKLRLGNPK